MVPGNDDLSQREECALQFETAPAEKDAPNLVRCAAAVTIGTIVYEDLSCCPRANGPQ